MGHRLRARRPRGRGALQHVPAHLHAATIGRAVDLERHPKRTDHDFASDAADASRAPVARGGAAFRTCVSATVSRLRSGRATDSVAISSDAVMKSGVFRFMPM